MKKILFNDKFGLTQSVLDGRKTQTRRIIPSNYWLTQRSLPGLNDEYIERADAHLLKYSRYKLGEVVAVAQSYKDCGYAHDALDRSPKDYRVVRGTLGESKGWNNKMFVRADACIHRIRITNVRVERLNDISDSDCKAEGIDYVNGHSESYFFGFGVKTDKGWIRLGNTPREAYAALIDKISGKGVWDSNPYVFVYDFELVKD